MFFFSVMKRLPVNILLGVIGDDEFDDLLAEEGNRGVKSVVVEGGFDQE